MKLYVPIFHILKYTENNLHHFTEAWINSYNT